MPIKRPAAPPPRWRKRVATAGTWALGALAAVTVSSTVVQGLRLRRAVRALHGSAAANDPFEQPMQAPLARGLVLGDSTAVGIGAAAPGQSVAGLLGAEFPAIEIVNRARSGARMADIWDQLPAAAEGPFDIVLLHAGGNDILRHTAHASLAREADRLLGHLCARSRTVVWLGPANIGRAPLFLPPWSWWLSFRTRRAGALFARVARRHGAVFVDFFRAGRADLFSRDPQRYFSADGIHPSSASYRYCYDACMRQAALRPLLRASLRPDARRRA